ncbi:MAG: DUF1611 domain-containing protein [Prochlorotrichaceae cyanobacterium]
MLTPQHRVAVLLHNGIQGKDGKTGLALLRYREGTIVAAIDHTCAGANLKDLTGIDRPVPIVASLAESLVYQPDVLAIGMAPSGGKLSDDYYQEVRQAVAAGLSIVNGLHTSLSSDPELKALLRLDQWIWDIRREPHGLKVGTAEARTLGCQRVLFVGTDMGVGKMSTALELDRCARQQGIRSRFVGTGQAGIMISGDGIPLDAVRVDFAAGAVEQLVMRCGAEVDLLFVEGQGSLLNPASTATLPLLRGSQPTALILVHQVSRKHIQNCPHVPIPPLAAVVKLYESIAEAGGAFPPVPVVGIALNTQGLSDSLAQAHIATTQAETGLPCTDVVRYGAKPLLDAVLGQG